jgi:hypothetical protein
MTDNELLVEILNMLKMIEWTIVAIFLITWCKKIIIKFRKGMGLND